MPAGEFVSVMGPSGSGKSTLLNLVSALDNPSSGRIVIDGEDTAHLGDDALTTFRRRKIGLIFQFFNLLPTLDALDNVLLPVMLERKVTTADKARAEELLSNVGFAARAKHRLHEILADEPTGNLDTATAASVLELLTRTCETAGTTLVLVTHDRNAATASDRIVSLRDGRIVNDQRTHELATEGAAE